MKTANKTVFGNNIYVTRSCFIASR